MKKRDALEGKKKKALKISIIEGSANSVSTGISNSYITPFALKLTDKELFIGILSSFSGLIGPLAQLYGSKLMEKYSRKKIVAAAMFWQAIMWLPIILIAVLKFYDIQTSALIYYLIIFYTLFASLAGIYYPPWFSWMGDLISDEERGRYFGKRNTIHGLIELVSVLIATLILKIGENTTYEILGFASIFFLSFIFRLSSYFLIHKQYTPHAKSRKEYSLKISTLIKQNKEYRIFATYQLFFNMAIMIASPFFAVYMLKELGFGYGTYIAITASSSIFYLIFTPLVGKFSDKYGNVRLLILANILFALNPLLWLFIKNPMGLIFIPQLVSGLANAAFIISFTNFSYDYLNKKERAVGIAYANILSGIGIFIGSILGGLLLDYLSISFMSKFLFVFAIAAILRALVAQAFLPKIREKKKVKRLPPMHVSVMHPFKSIHAEIGWVKHTFG